MQEINAVLRDDERAKRIRKPQVRKTRPMVLTDGKVHPVTVRKVGDPRP